VKVLQSPDIVISCLLFSLCLSVVPSTAASRTLIVLDGWLLRTFKLFEKRNRRSDGY
jgi:hypothetical protein